jgi:hypothetical protein
MGRPVNKRNFGATGDTAANIPIRFKTGDNVIEGYIVKQKASRRFLCSNGSTTAICKLVQGTSSDPVNNGEATLVGLVNGSSPVTLQKISNKIAVDFDSIRYKWEAQDDSSESLLILTPL